MVLHTIPIFSSASVGLSLGLLLFLPLPCGAQPKKDTPISPDPKIQELIRRFINAQDFEKDEDHPDGLKAMKSLNELANKKPDVLGPQLIYYDLRTRNEQEGLGMMRLNRHFILNWGPDMQGGLIPLLETNDKKVSQAARSWLADIDGFAGHGRGVDIGSYRKRLSDQKKAPPPGLVDYLFGYPGKSLVLFGEIYSSSFFSQY